jgi:hypothetical protein
MNAMPAPPGGWLLSNITHGPKAFQPFGVVIVNRIVSSAGVSVQPG